jgi:hypothetical protein
MVAGKSSGGGGAEGRAREPRLARAIIRDDGHLSGNLIEKAGVKVFEHRYDVLHGTV